MAGSNEPQLDTAGHISDIERWAAFADKPESEEEAVNSLALEFDKIAIEAREKEAFQCMALFRGARNTNDVYLLIHDRARDHKAQLVEHPRQGDATGRRRRRE